MAICVSGPIDRLGARPGERYAADLKRAATALEQLLRSTNLADANHDIGVARARVDRATTRPAAKR